MADENCWRTPTFRQSVVQKIDEAIRTSGMATSRNSMEMESHVFQKARSKEEYLGFVARLILHVREMSTKKTGMNGPNQGGPGMPDPINALQNLASQGSRNSQMIGGMGTPPQGQQMGGSQQVGPQNATNLLQTLNRGPAPGMGNMPVGMQGNMSNTIQPNMAQMGGQMAGNIPVGMQGTGGRPPKNLETTLEEKYILEILGTQLTGLDSNYDGDASEDNSIVEEDICSDTDFPTSAHIKQEDLYEPNNSTTLLKLEEWGAEKLKIANKQEIFYEEECKLKLRYMPEKHEQYIKHQRIEHDVRLEFMKAEHEINIDILKRKLK